MARTIDGDDVIELSRALQALVSAGVPLDVGLEEFGSGMSSSLNEAATTLADRVNRGESVLEALESQPSIPPVFRAIITAGFESGATQEFLDDVCEVTESLVELRGAVRRGMVYPLIVVAMSLFLFAVIMPRMVWAQVQVFQSVRGEIPAWLRSLQSATQWITQENLALGLIAFLAALFVWRMLGKRQSLVSGLNWIPGARRVLRDADLSRTMHVLGLMLKYGMPLPEALRLAEPTSQSGLHRQELHQMADALEHGESLVTVIERQKTLPPFLRWMIAVGVQDSSLATSLRQAGDFYQRRATSRARVLQTVVPSLVIGLVAGGVTLLYGVTIFGPIQSLWEVIGSPR